MLRKVSWTVLGIAGLSLLMCGGCTAEAQSGGAEAQQVKQPDAAAPQRQASGQASPAGEDADLQRSVAELRAEVSQLRQEVTRLRAQVAEPGTGGSGAGTGDTRADTARSGEGPGTGGSGSVGDTDAQAGSAGSAQGTGVTGEQAGTASAGQGTGGAGTPQGTGVKSPVVSDVPPAGSNVPTARGTAVVNAVYTGKLISVSPRQVVIDTGSDVSLTLGVGPGTQVLRDGRNIGALQLKKGEQVRAVVDMVGQHQTLEIAVLPKAAPEE
ncbi:hypothetical protein [Pyxidicoccus caerfyrddinensis]|uniref:hypothetical protein n=1 Tax=Pyxidicoccus caerfyrddinensis TaxID=2709663 RepID=UPI0013DBBB71|nr:hypothetical protein [Pyxidicoccus caerfyrddinensis]